MTPVGTDKLNLTSSGTLTGYGLKMITPDAAGSIDLAAKTAAVSIVINGMSRDRGAEAMRAMVDLFAAGVPGMTPPKPGAPPTADPKLSPAGMAALKRLVATLPDLGSSMKLDESVSDLAVNAMGKTFAASKVGFTMDMKSVSGQLQGVMGLVAQNMVWPDLGVGDLSGKAILTASGIPIKQSQPIDSASVVFIAGQGELTKLFAGFTGLPVSSVTIGSGAVQVGTTVTALGVTVPVAIAFVPSVVGGQLALTPKSLVVNGATLTPAALRSTFGALADPLLATQKVCVAKYLPKQLPLDSVTVKGSSLELAVSGRSVTLSTALLTTKGVCA